MVERQIESKLHDFKELGLPLITPRDCPLYMGDGMASTVLGARRAGKSYRVLQAANEMIQTGFIPSLDHVCPLDFDNPHFSDMKATDLSIIQKTFIKMNPGFDLNTPILFLLDEIHKIQGWEEYIVDLSRNRNWKVIVTGSSSKMLRENIATELRGKSISSMVYPLSFPEFLRFKNVVTATESTASQARLARLFEEYLQWGSYPAMCTADERAREPLLREYFDVMILRDIVQRYEVSQPRACTAVLRHLLSNIARPFTVQSCHLYAMNAGFHIGKESIMHWLDWAQDSWLLFSVPIFTSSTKELERNYRKAYCIDWALANSNSLIWDGGYSHALENMVFLHLVRRWQRVHYYLTRSKRQEIDFVCVDNKGNIGALVQVCQEFSDAATEKREIEPLVASAQYFGCKECVVVTRSEERTIKEPGVTIRIVPAHRWLLEFRTGLPD